jgi:ribonucleoside-diphosphate reductase alpha chain
MVPDEDTEEMVEKKVSRYDIKYITNDNKSVTVDGISNVFNPEFYNYSKLISGLLRHGMPIEYILSTVKSLDFKVDSINSWKNGVMRALKSYITDGVTKELCSKCGSPLYRENGCVICKNCGDSKCG